MIGGKDNWFPVPRAMQSLDVAVGALRGQWPKAVFDDAQTGQRWLRYEDIDFTHCAELLVYRDAKAAAQWDELGADESLRDTMIHFVVENEGITIVTDSSPSRQVQALVDAIEKALRSDAALRRG